jgi:rhodanese-related sulfurtransferase
MFGFFAHPVPQTEPQEVARRLGSERPPYILDVREPSEYVQGHIPGSHLIPLGTLDQRLGEVPKDQDVVTVCRSGARSGKAAKILAAAGFKVVNMAGGMMAWPGPVDRP